MAAGNSFIGEVSPAKHSRRKSEMVTALAEANTNSEFWPEIVSRISDGEFVSTIALELKVNYSILRNWIRGDKAREQEFTQAEADGKQARIQRVLKRVHDTATAESEAPVTTMESLRAAEIALKQQEHEKAPMQKFTGDIQINFVAAENGRPAGKIIDQLP